MIMQLDTSVKESFSDISFRFVILQESGNFLEVIERFHKSVAALPKISAQSLKKKPVRLSRIAALDTLVVSKILKVMFSETRLKESI